MKRNRSGDLEIVLQQSKALQPRPGNPRVHSRAQIRQIARSIEEFGFNNPVLIDAEGPIVAGRGRVEAAKLLGLAKIPTIRLDHMSQAQLRAFVLADNRLAERSSWDKELLAKEFERLTGQCVEFDITTTGFGTGAIDLLLGETDGGESPMSPTRCRM